MSTVPVGANHLSQEEFVHWMRELHRPSKRPREIFLTRLNVFIRADKPGMCRDAMADGWRAIKEKERKEIERFVKQFEKECDRP